MHSIKKEHRNIFFHGRRINPIPTISALRGYSYKQPLCACGVAGLIKNIFLYSFLLIMTISASTNVFASVAGEVNKANDLYKQGKFDDSLDLYQGALGRDAKSAVIKYDLGTALYKKGDYAKALGYLEQAARDKNIKIRSKAEYNLGNVLYKSGIQKENTDVNQAIKTLQKALGQYVQYVRDVPNDPDAEFNQDVVKKEIERLKKKKQQQQHNQQQQQDQKQQQQNQQNQQNQQDQENQKSQQNQQNQQNQQKQQEGQQSQEANSKDQKKQQQDAQAQAEENQKQLDRKQAEDLLEEYQENEEPKKLLNYMPKKIDDRPVLKDW